ncbi:hypothetical protein N007_17135 [Alicyclobacillus acidoterrestris ATCC 49025]|nr:hypothetical protein N007_17135 [Alicyclobacillus acidoterrestris ATCC 49025]
MSDKLMSSLETLRKSSDLDLVIRVDARDKEVRVDTQDNQKGHVAHYINLGR